MLKRMYFNEVFGVSAKYNMILMHVFKPLSPTSLPPSLGWGLEHKPLNGAISGAIYPHQSIQIDIARIVSIHFFSFQRLQY